MELTLQHRNHIQGFETSDGRHVTRIEQNLAGEEPNVWWVERSLNGLEYSADDADALEAAYHASRNVTRTTSEWNPL